MKKLSVYCESCKEDLPGYRKIADKIRETVSFNVGDVLDIINIAIDPDAQIPRAITIAVSVPQRIAIASERRRRKILNLVEFPCPHCDKYHRWKRSKNAES